MSGAFCRNHFYGFRSTKYIGNISCVSSCTLAENNFSMCSLRALGDVSMCRPVGGRVGMEASLIVVQGAVGRASKARAPVTTCFVFC